MGEIETVARAICKAAGSEVRKTNCSMCEHGICQLWKSFREEARAARTALDGYRINGTI